MRIEIEQPKLLALLSRVTAAVEKRNTIPVLSNILLQAEGNTLTAIATDLDLEVTTTADATVIEAGATTVNAATLQAIVAKLSKGKAVLLNHADDTLQIQSGRSDLSLATLPVDDFPRFANPEYDAEFQASQSQLARLFNLAAFAMSAEETRYYLKGVYFHSVDGAARAVSTDGHRLAHIDTDIEAEFHGVIVPSKTVTLLRSLLAEGDATVSVSDGKIRFDLGDTVVASKVINNTFPDYTRVIPKDHKSTVTVNASDVKQASALVSLVSAEKTRAVKLSATDGTLTLTVRSGADVGIEEVDAELEGPDVECGFNSKYLADVLGNCNGDSAVLKFCGSGDPVVIRPSEDDKALYVVMPMRV